MTALNSQLKTPNFSKCQEPEYLPVPPHSSRRVCGRAGKTSSRKRRMRAVDEIGGSRASLPLEKLEVTCYAESFLAHGRRLSFGGAFDWSLPDSHPDSRSGIRRDNRHRDPSADPRE